MQGRRLSPQSAPNEQKLSTDPHAGHDPEPATLRRRRVRTIIAVATLSGMAAGYIGKNAELGFTVFGAVVSVLGLDPDR